MRNRLFLFAHHRLHVDVYTSLQQCYTASTFLPALLMSWKSEGQKICARCTVHTRAVTDECKNEHVIQPRWCQGAQGAYEPLQQRPQPAAAAGASACISQGRTARPQARTAASPAAPPAKTAGAAWMPALAQ